MIRAAIVGLGWWGKHMVRRMKDSDALRIVAGGRGQPGAGGASPPSTACASRRSSLTCSRDPQIDAVILCTPHSLHTEQVLAAAARRQARVLREAAGA